MTTDNAEAVNPSSFVPSFDEPSGEGGIQDSPLLDFWGVGAGWFVRAGIGKNSGKPWQRIGFKFLEIEVIESTAPYPLPAGELSIFYSDPKTTQKRVEGQGTSEWVHFGDSVKALGMDVSGTQALDRLFGGRYVEGQPTPKGIRQHWKKLPKLTRVGPDAAKYQAAIESGGNPDDPAVKLLNEWHDEPTLCWQIIEAEGMAKAVTASIDYVLEMANGKVAGDFYKEALADEKVRSNASLVSELTGRTFIPTMETLGRISIDAEGVIHFPAVSGA